VVLAACSRDEPTPAPRPAPTPVTASSIARALHLDAAAVLESPVDPPAPPGDLRADIDAFTTIDACVAQRAALDPLVGDALHAIGYETFLRDACRTLQAAKAKDARECEAIDAEPLRARCRMLVAVLAGDADACPFFVDIRPAMGRDPTCLAVAGHDARLCAAAETLDRPACEALASRDPRPCNVIPRDADRAVCGRELARWSTVLPEPPEGRPAFGAPAGKLTIHVRATAAPRPDAAEDDAGPAAADVDVDLARDLARGVVLVEQHDGTHLDLGTLREASPTIHANPPLALPHVGLSIVLGSTSGKAVHTDHCELGLPNEATHVSPGASCYVEVVVEKLDHARGGDARLKVHGVVDAYSFDMSVSTFVRDVVKPKH
jgi:hypothetical protein